MPVVMDICMGTTAAHTGFSPVWAAGLTEQLRSHVIHATTLLVPCPSLQEEDLGWSSGVWYNTTTTTSPPHAIAAATPFSRLGNESGSKLTSVFLRKSVCLTVTKEAGR